MTPACAWCGAVLDGGAQRLRGRIRCGACGAATTEPWPTGAELAAAYADWYRPAGAPRFAGAGDRLLRRSRAALAGRVDAIAPPGAVLDVGAGDGTLVAALHRTGREALGLEREGARPGVVDRPLEVVEGEWAAVVFWHSLEHLPAPRAAVGHAARLLGRRGVVIVAVPDAGSVQARVFGDRWLHLDPPRHLVHLTTRSLRAGLEAAGLRVERVSRLRGGQNLIGWLDGLVGSLPGGLNLYQSLRRRDARDVELSRAKRAGSVAAGVALFPVALACAVVEAALGRSGTVYVEARRV